MILAGIGIFLFTVVLQGIFAGYEAGFISANRIRIRHMAEEDHDRTATRVMWHLRHPDRLITTLIIGNNVSLVLGTIALARALAALPARDLIVLVIATPLFLLSEFIPKTVFRHHATRLTLALLPILQFFFYTFAVLTYPLTALTRGMMRLIGHSQESLSPLMSSLEDVRNLVDESVDQGHMDPDEQRMIHSVIDMHSTRASEIMVPRIDVKALPITATRQELLELFKESGCTRIPIYEETIDRIIGVINAYDVFIDTNPDDPDIKRFVHPVLHVPDSIIIGDLFQEMKRSKQHMAIIVDEYGGTDGLITLEDILEEIFGEIQDESDREHRQIYQVAPRAFVVDARMALDDASAIIGVPIVDDEVDTIGGWVLHVAGRIPAQGEVVHAPGFRITILDADRTRVSKIRLETIAEPAETAGTA